MRLEPASLSSASSVSTFQFHKGAIRTIYLVLLILPVANFNSIKVRLEREMGIGISNDLLFQFHKGAIRTLRLATKLTECYNFNSIKVRLERKKAYKYFFTSE